MKKHSIGGRRGSVYDDPEAPTSFIFEPPRKSKGPVATFQELPGVPRSHKYFGVQIKGHPDNPAEKKESDKKEGLKNNVSSSDLDEDSEQEFEDQRYTESTQVIFQDGRVSGLQVDKEIISEIERNAKESNYMCQCCGEVFYEVSTSLEDQREQARYIFKVLMIENVLHLAPLIASALQFYVKAVHDFVYEQWALVLLMIFVLTVTMVWAIVCNDLARQNPADNALLCMKFFTHALAGMLINGVTERLVVVWVLKFEDVPYPGELINVYLARSNSEWKYTYPFLVPLHLIELSLVYFILSLYFWVLKGNIKKDKMFWLVLTVQLSLSAAFLTLYFTNVLDEKIFFGPGVWDASQLFFISFGTSTWELWRFYSLRQVLAGRKYKVNEGTFKKTALGFM